MQSSTLMLSVVIPVYNEAQNLEPLHRELSSILAGRHHEIIYVDDGSTDGSWAVLKEITGNAETVAVALRLRRNFGQTAALAAGFDAAHGDVIIAMDADLQNDPADIPRLLDKIEEGYEVVSGWRANRKDDFFKRILPSRVANWFISKMTGVPLRDYGCTLKAYRREVLEHLGLYGEMHRFLPALASWSGAQVGEIVVNHRPRLHGKSKYGLDRTIRVILDLMTVKFLLNYSTRPMQSFGRWGFLSIFAGMAAGLIALIQKLGEQKLSLNRNGWFFLAFFFILGGVQFIAMGLLSEIAVRTYHESQNKPIYLIRERCGRTLDSSGSNANSAH